MNEKNNEYEIYTTKLFRVIPKNCALVVRSKFNGANVKAIINDDSIGGRSVKKAGFTFISPFKESRLVSLAIRNFDYPKQLFEDKDGQDIIVDLAVTVKVIDPIKYLYINTNVEAELKQLIESMMRSLVKKYRYEQLSGSRFTLPDSNTPANNANLPAINEELTKARKELDNFGFKYGLRVVSLYNKSIQQTARVQEAYNKKIIAEREAEAAEIEKQGERRRAEIEAEIIKTKAEAEAEAEKKKLESRYEALISAIKDLPREKQAEILKIFSLGGNANVFMSVGGDDAVKTGVVAGSVMDSKNKSK